MKQDIILTTFHLKPPPTLKATGELSERDHMEIEVISKLSTWDVLYLIAYNTF